MQEVVTRRPIVEPQTGTTLVDAGEKGIIQNFSVDDGVLTEFIPISGTPDIRLNRRLKFEVDFDGNTQYVTYPEDVDFKDKIGLLQTLMKGAVILDVANITPTPRFQSEINVPFAVTFHLDNNLKITLISDHTSGLLNVEVEANISE